MSEYMFGVSRTRPTAEAKRTMERVAKQHGVSFVDGVFPGDGYQHWFTTPNLGSPFNEATAKAVYDDLEKEGLQCRKKG
jgi:hypothetical protein